jgi:ABC-type branched-subunit amino acid transport system ATPase component
MTEMLTAVGLNKYFGGLKAVDKVGFTIRKSEILLSVC